MRTLNVQLRSNRICGEWTNQYDMKDDIGYDIGLLNGQRWSVAKTIQSIDTEKDIVWWTDGTCDTVETLTTTGKRLDGSRIKRFFRMIYVYFFKRNS